MPKSLWPTGADETDIGDPIFDGWVYSRHSDGSRSLKLAERGARCASGFHRSWSSILKAGNNLIIDYSVIEKSLFADLLQVFKKALGSAYPGLIAIDLQFPLSPICEREKSGASKHPVGFVLSSHKLCRDIIFDKNIKNVHKIEVPFGIQTDKLADLVYTRILDTGLV